MKNKDIAYYEALPYTIVVRKEEDYFVARIQELPGCIAHGGTEAKAIELLRDVRKLWLEDAIEAGDAVPEPEAEAALPSGKWVQRVPRKLHRDLVRLAEHEKVSLNALVTSMLTEAATGRSCVHALETYLATRPQFAAPDHHKHLFWGWAEMQEMKWSSNPVVSVGLKRGIERVQKIAKSNELMLLNEMPLDKHHWGTKATC